MSSAAATIEFHRADPQRLTDLAILLIGEGFHHRHTSTEIDAPLRLFEVYLRDHAPVGFGRRLAAGIHRVDPCAGFTFHHEAVPERAAEQITSDPDLGEFTSPADELGEPLIPAHALQRALDPARHGRIGAEELVRRVDQLCGGPWRREIERLDALDRAS